MTTSIYPAYAGHLLESFGQVRKFFAVGDSAKVAGPCHIIPVCLVAEFVELLPWGAAQGTDDMLYIFKN